MTHTLLILLLIVFQAPAPQQSKSAKEYFDSALVRLQKEDLDGTIADLTKAIELNPNYVDAIFIRGQCLFLKGDRDKALSWLERGARERDPWLYAMSINAPVYASIWPDPRFAEVARTMGLDPAAMTRPVGGALH